MGGKTVIVHQVLNNNLISTLDENREEVLLWGKGIGWKSKRGQAVDESKIEKIFRMDTSDSMNRLKQLLGEVDDETIEASSEIIEYARGKLDKKLNRNVYITLTDHISFAVERQKKGINFHNVLRWEIRKFYAAEYAIGKHALDIIKEKMHMELPEDEAGAIALHIVNSVIIAVPFVNQMGQWLWILVELPGWRIHTSQEQHLNHGNGQLIRKDCDMFVNY